MNLKYFSNWRLLQRNRIFGLGRGVPSASEAAIGCTEQHAALCWKYTGLSIQCLSQFTNGVNIYTHKIPDEGGTFIPFLPTAASLDTYGRLYLQENQS